MQEIRAQLLRLSRNHPDYFFNHGKKKFLKAIGLKVESKAGSFNIKPEAIRNVRFELAKRKKGKFRQKLSAKAVQSKGRIIRHLASPMQSSTLLSLPTIMSAITRGGYSLQGQSLEILKTDFRYPQYDQPFAYNIMMVLDSSNSIRWFIPHIEKIISGISSGVAAVKDKIGLIGFRDDRASIFHYPTINSRLVLGTINSFSAEGLSPLGSGLEMAARVLAGSRYKKPGMKNMVLLISDCFPEPLEGIYEDLFDEPAYKEVLAVARRLKQDSTGLTVINPSAYNREEPTWGQKLGKAAANAAGGRYIEIACQASQDISSIMKTHASDAMLSQAVNQVFDAVNGVEGF